MSLQGVKVGDVVITTDVNRKGHRREAVTAVGRKYITAGRKYDIKTGGGTGPWASHYRAYTEAQWVRREAEDALYAALVRVDHRAVAVMSDDEIRTLTVTLQGVAARLEKAK